MKKDKFKLTKEEKAIEDALVKREYVDVSKEELKSIADATAEQRKELHKHNSHRKLH